VPNIPETIVAALGRRRSARSVVVLPDFGVQGCSIASARSSRALVAADGYFYGGKTFDSLPRLAEVLERLPTVERTVIIPYTRRMPAAGSHGRLRRPAPRRAAVIRATAVRSSVYILYSSGTTGVPKCIVHGAGGTLIQRLKEHQLLCDIHPGDRVSTSPPAAG
jgi:acetoacetyl-CoA synthetase